MAPAYLAALAAVPWIAACTEDSTPAKMESPTIAARLVEVIAAPTSAAPGQAVSFSARLADESQPGEIIRWTFQDGGQLIGPNVTRSFGEAGIQPVLVEAVVAGQVRFDQPTSVSIFDPTTGAVPELTDLASMPGDVDLDGMLSLADVRALVSAIDEEGTALDPDAFSAADMNLDRKIDQRDLEVLSQLVMGNGDPALLTPSSGVPGTLVTLYSSALNNLGEQVEIDINGRILRPDRFVAGQVGFLIPFDLDTPGSLNVAPGSRRLDLRVGGAQVGSFDFTVESYGNLPSDPVGMFRELLTQQTSILNDLVPAVDAFLATQPQIGADSRLVAVDWLRVATEESSAGTAAFLQYLETLDPELHPLLARALVAADVPNALASANTLVARGQNFRGGIADLSTLCLLEDLIYSWELVSSGSTIVCGSMIAAAVGSALVPGVGIATSIGGVILAVELWAPSVALQGVLDVVVSLLPRVGDRIRLDLEGTLPLREGDSVEVVPYIEIQGLSQICSAAVRLGPNKLLEWIIGGAVRRMLNAGPFAPLAALARLGLDSIYNRVVNELSSAAAAVISVTPLDDIMQGIAIDLCNGYVGTTDVELDAAGIFNPPDPAIGSLSFPGTTGTGSRARYTYFFNPAVLTPAEGIRISAAASYCGRLLEGEVFVPVGEADVIITMGDNGFANDDIFEIILDGTSFLTTSVPERNVSKSVLLPNGDHTLQMAGRAAPDGIGTYFITVDGGVLLNGPPTSGTDLVPGVVHTWTLQVGGGN